MPKREKQIQVKRIDEDDLRYWAEQIINPNPADSDERRDEQLAHRVPNLADIMSVLDFYIRVKNQELFHIMRGQSKEISILRQVVMDKLEVTEEELKEYSDDFDKKFEADRKIVEKFQELQAKGGDMTEKDMQDFEELAKELAGVEDQPEEE